MSILTFTLFCRVCSSVNRVLTIQRSLASNSMRRNHNGKFKAVIFDMGGVLVQGPGNVFQGLCYTKPFNLHSTYILFMRKFFIQIYIYCYEHIFFAYHYLCCYECILDYEKAHGLERGLIVSTIVKSGGDSAWCRMERGEYPATQLGKHLSAEIKSLVRG